MTAEKGGFDRSKFKGAKVASNKAAINEAEEKTNTFSGGRAGYHTISEGKSVWRIAPPHNPDDPALEPICKVWLPRSVKDDKGVTVIKNMPVFNSKVHSPLSVDIVDAYIDFGMKLYYKEYSKDEAKKKLCHITGYKDMKNGGKWVSGIRPNLSYDAYSWNAKSEIGRINFIKTVVDRMNELSISEEADETISVDPFSDPDTGVSLIIEYNKSAESAKKWLINKGTTPKKVEDELLKEWSELESLADMLRNAYTRTDFEHAVEGLTIFDEKHSYGFMQMEEFIDIMEDIKEQVWNCPEIRESNKTEEDGESTEKSAKQAPVKEVKKVEVKKTTKQNHPLIEDDIQHETPITDSINDEVAARDAEEDDGLGDMNLQELKDYITDSGIDVIVKPAYTPTVLVRKIREKIAEMQQPKSEEKKDDLPFTVVDEKPKMTAKERLEALKKGKK